MTTDDPLYVHSVALLPAWSDETGLSMRLLIPTIQATIFKFQRVIWPKKL